MNLAGRVALVTGGAHRVGAAIASALAAEGMRVAISYHSASSAADALVERLYGEGHESIAVRCDLTSAGAPEKLVDQVVSSLGALDLLVNSAAVMRRTPLGSVTYEEWDAMFALNLRAPFFLAQAARAALAKGRGSIVNIADLAAYETWPAYVPHSITKAGIIQLTRGLAHALAPDVRVNAIAPGAVMLPAGWTEESAERLASTTPLKRLGDAQDVADAVLYLARAEYVTGETIVVDGGRRVRV